MATDKIKIENKTNVIKHLPRGEIELLPGQNEFGKEKLNALRSNLNHPLVKEDINNNRLVFNLNQDELDGPDDTDGQKQGVKNDNEDENEAGDDSEQSEEDEIDEDEELVVEHNPSDYNVGPFLKIINEEDDPKVLAKYKEMEKKNKDRVTIIYAIEDKE